MKKKQGKLYISLINNGSQLYREECTLYAICRMIDTFNLDSQRLMDQVWPAYITKYKLSTEDVDLVIHLSAVRKSPQTDEHYYVSSTANGGLCTCGKYLKFEPIAYARSFHMTRHINEVMSNVDSFDGPYPRRISADDYRNFYMRPRAYPKPMEPLRKLIESLVTVRTLPPSSEREQTITYYLNEIDRYMKG